MFIPVEQRPKPTPFPTFRPRGSDADFRSGNRRRRGIAEPSVEPCRRSKKNC
jgi:hypothetical protein